MGADGLAFVMDRLPELWQRTGEHLVLTGVSTLFAVLIGVPLGVLALRQAWLRGPILGVAGVLQTVPSLAMLAILLVLLGRIGALPAILALIMYALLPIVRNTLAGLQGAPPAAVEAARGIGMTPRQELWMVRMPLAMPVIVAGIRTAAVVSIGVATLSAFIGAGGLGQFINRGLALANPQLILLGAVPAAVLALLVDGAIGSLEWWAKARRRRPSGAQARREALLRPLALAFPAALFIAALAAVAPLLSLGGPGAQPVRIGAKDFAEQFILGEMMAQIIEDRTDSRVDRRFNLGGTMICHGALIRGEIDVYAEYTGTALTAVLDEEVITDPGEALAFVRDAYEDRWGAAWLEPFGINNTYAITVRRAEAEARGWTAISDLADAASDLRAGFTPEFAERPDGYPGLSEAYGFRFGAVRDMDAALMYQAVARDEVDVVSAFATDGRIPAFDLLPLEDDRQFFPPYHAAPVARGELLEERPELREALSLLADRLDDGTMQRLNYEVDEEGRDAFDVARDFLVAQGLVEGD